MVRVGLQRLSHGRGLSRAGLISAGFVSLLLAGCGVLLTPQHRLERAQKELRAGEWQAAAVDLRIVVQKQPNNAQAWLLLAQVSLDAADLTGAQSGLSHALAVGAKGPKVDDLRARIWIAAGQPKRLLDAITQGSINLPEPERTLMTAHALLVMQQPDAALAKLQPLAAAQPDLIEAREMVAEALANEGKFTAALQQLDQAMQHDAKAPGLPLLKGLILQGLGEYGPAEEALELALKHMPPSEPIDRRVRALIALTEVRLGLGELNTAAASAARVAKFEPHSPAAVLLDARLKIARKNTTAAVSELERLVLAAPGYTQARLLLGATLLQRGDLQQAQEQLEQVVQSAPDNLAARKLLAQVQLKLGQPQGALGVLNAALSSDTLDPQLLALYGAAASSAGDKQALIEALQSIASQHPNDQMVLLNLGTAYLAEGHAEQALAVLQKTTNDSDPRRDRLLVTALLAARGPADAGAEVQRLLAAHPHDADLLDLAASYYITQNRTDDARAMLRTSLSINADNVSSLVSLASLDEAAGDSGAAKSRLQGALKAHPDSLPIRFALADVMVRMRAYDSARALLQAAGPNAGPRVQFGLAEVALAGGDLKTANAELDQAIAAQPGRAEAVEEAGLLLMKANQFDAALARFAAATRLAPDSAGYWINSARAQLALNQPLDARASLNKADQLQPNSLPVVGMLALIDVREGHGQSARARVQALLGQRPSDPGALELEGEVESALKDPGGAAAAYAKAMQLSPSARLAASLYQASLAAHAPDPQQTLEQWLAREPQSWPIRDLLGEYYLDAGQSPRRAVQEFKTVIAQNPNDVVALNDLAWALNEAGDPGAEAFAERAYRLAPNVANINDTLGWILARSGKAAGAVDYLRRAASLDPSDPNVEYHLAYALVATGHSAEARQILGKILATAQPFDTRRDAQRLLTSMKS